MKTIIKQGITAFLVMLGLGIAYASSTIGTKYLNAVNDTGYRESTPVPTAGGSYVKEKENRESRCTSGFTVIPSALVLTYSEQSQRGEQITPAEASHSLRNDIDFYGFTYPFNGSSEAIRDQTYCTDVVLEPQKVQFVSHRLNLEVKKFISAVIVNETQINDVENKRAQDPQNKAKVDLCLDTACGTNNPVGKFQSFQISSDADLRYASSYSDTILYVNALNQLRSVSQSSESTSFTDSEIVQILSVARGIATRN